MGANGNKKPEGEKRLLSPVYMEPWLWAFCLDQPGGASSFVRGLVYEAYQNQNQNQKASVK